MGVKKVTCTSEELVKMQNELLLMGTREVSQDIIDSIKSRYKLLYLVSSEEERVVRFIRRFCQSQSYNGFIWDCSRGLNDIMTMKAPSTSKLDEEESSPTISEDITDPAIVLNYILDSISCKSYSNGRIYILLDFDHFLQSEQGYVLERKLKQFSRSSATDTIIIVSPEYVSTPGLDKEVTVVDFPYPSKDEIRAVLNKVKEKVAVTYPDILKAAVENEEEIIWAATGLTLTEARNALAKTVVKDKKFTTTTLLHEKAQIIRKSRLLEYCNPDITMDDVGGFTVLKKWFESRKSSFTQEALDFGVPVAKGIFLCGPPGCGKSFICKALANFYSFPLLRMDMGAMFDSHVGASEKRIREALKIADALAPAILYIDEIDKGVSGGKGSNDTDGGTTARVIGTLLTWMQEKTSKVFIVATANSTATIPAEMLRAGRFDEIFFLDLPHMVERADIVSKLILRKRRDPSKFDLNLIAKCSEGYTGAEIEKAVDNAVIFCFSQNKKELTTEDIVRSFGEFIPLSKSRSAEIETMRAWAKDGRAIIANSDEPVKNLKVKNSPKIDKPNSDHRVEIDLDEDCGPLDME